MDHDPHADEPTAEELADETLLDGLIGAELGERLAGLMRRARAAEEAWYRGQHPNEGLRERKRRLTRQLISDAAAALFTSRGFDAVKVSEIARRVGVSEKTIYNYFPTKEAMVLDAADERVDNLVAALRARAPQESITEAVVRAVEIEVSRPDAVADALAEFVPRFLAMVEGTPSLHAAWLEVHARLARVATEELATQAGVDPEEPEPVVAGRALVGLIEVGMRARIRHTRNGLRGQALRDAMIDDVHRAARLLDTGLRRFTQRDVTESR